MKKKHYWIIGIIIIVFMIVWLLSKNSIITTNTTETSICDELANKLDAVIIDTNNPPGRFIISGWEGIVGGTLINIESGYCLYSNTQDGTPYRFFKLIGFECPKGIENCSTGCKGIYREEKFFKNKWPTDEDWIKILSNVDVSGILRNKRKNLGLTQKQLAEQVKISREHVRDVENGKQYASVVVFRKALKALNLDVKYLLSELNKNYSTNFGD